MTNVLGYFDEASACMSAVCVSPTDKTRILSILHRLEENPEYLQNHWSVPAEAGRFLYLITLIHQAKKVLEIGTSIGYSGLWFSAAILETGGFLETIDASSDRLSQAQAHFQEAGLLDTYVKTHCGDALRILTSLVEKKTSYDLLFLDAHKAQYVNYLEYGEKLLTPHGLLIADNTHSHRTEMSAFLDRIAQSSQWEYCDLDTPNGLLLARLL